MLLKHLDINAVMGLSLKPVGLQGQGWSKAEPCE